MRNQRVWGWKGCGAVLCWCLGLLGVGHAQTSPSLTYSTIFSFDLSRSAGGVVEDNGTLFGTLSNSSLSYGGAVYKVSIEGGAPETIYQLSSTDGYLPTAPLLVGSDGYLYGSTMYGARTSIVSLYSGSGTLFRVKKDGTGFQTLHRFDAQITNPTVVIGGVSSTSQVNSDGLYPAFPLIQDSAQSYLYGVTSTGGTNGTGVIFRVKSDGSGFEVLHTFASLGTDGSSNEGAFPSGPLLLAQDGRLYGVTSGGGVNLYTKTNNTDLAQPVVTTRGTGTVYSLKTTKDEGNPNNPFDFQTIYSFPALADQVDADTNTVDYLGTNDIGAFPSQGLIEVEPGVLVGTTQDGGGQLVNATTGGLGTVYRLRTDGTGATNLLSFDATTTGYGIKGNLVLKDSRLYGISTTGVSQVFSIKTDGSDFVSQYSFVAPGGTIPSSGLTLASNGDFVGTTSYGGVCTSYGVVYRLGSGTATSYSNCTATTSSGGGGAMDYDWLAVLAGLLLVTKLKRRRLKADRSL